MIDEQIKDFDGIPTTRYQGSKRRLLPWLHHHFLDIKFQSALDLCGGTSVVSYLLKKMGKEVTYNDILKFNYWIGLALIENSRVKLSEKDITYLLNKHSNVDYPSFIQKTFKDIYYLDDENKFLDIVIKNIQDLENNYEKNIALYKKAISFFALFQSCIIKRPFNLFHRKNLHLRTNNVQRKFGNKITWDRSFQHYFIKFALEANRSIFNNGANNTSLNFDAYEYPNKDYDLVYMDPPYIPLKNVYRVRNYYKDYHFLEGIVNYNEWPSLIDNRYPHLPLINDGYSWKSKNGNIEGFEKIFSKFRDSIIVISYKEPGLPSIEELSILITQFKKCNIKIYKKPYYYALNKNNGHYSEILLIAE